MTRIKSKAIWEAYGRYVKQPIYKPVRIFLHSQNKNPIWSAGIARSST